MYGLFTYQPPQLTDDEWHRANQEAEDDYYLKKEEEDRIENEHRATQELLDRMH